MMKLVVRNYFAAFRWNNIKEKMKKGELYYLLFYWLWIMPMLWGVWQTKEKAVIYYMLVIPMLFFVLSIRIHPMRMPKIMFLCPMNKRMRKEYINKFICFRILNIILVGGIGIAVLMLDGLCDWICAIGLFLNICVVAITYYSDNLNSYNGKKESYQIDIDTIHGLLESINLLISIILSVVYGEILLWDSPVAFWVKLIPLGITVFLQIPLTIRHLRFWDNMVEYAIHYESNFAVKGN